MAIPTNMQYFNELLGEQLGGGGGGGGGTSGLHTATITLEVSTNTFQNAYTISFYAGESEDTETPVYSGCVINDGVLSTENIQNIIVTNPVSVTQEVEIINNQSIIVFTSSASEVYTVSGDAEVATVDGFNIVKVYGDCTISTPGTR